MLKSLVTARANPADEHIEAVTAERDFFREKYINQMNEMEALKNKLKESQRVIDRLRKQVLDLEMEKCSASGGDVALSPASDGKKEKLGGGSSNTSLTDLTNGEEEEIKSSPCSVMESLQPKVEKSAGLSIDCSAAINEQSTNDDEAASNTQNLSPEMDEEEDGPSDNEEDDADRIRAQAERLLQWSDYQARRSTLSPSTTPKHEDATQFVYDVTEPNVSMDDSYSMNSPGAKAEMNTPERSNSRGEGKMSRLLSNLKDIIDPPSDSGSDSDDDRDESTDEESERSTHRRSYHD